MSIFAKPAQQLTATDLQALVDDEVPEDLHIEYKSEFNPESRDAKKDIAADVAAFANTHGGCLLLGVEEAQRVARHIKGIAIGDPDKFILRIQSSIRDFTQPAIDGIEFGIIPVEGDRHVVALRVPQSWARPHMANYRFHGRTSGGTFLFDVTQIRSLFTFGHEIAERARRFHLNRFHEIRDGRWSVPNRMAALLVFHIIPYRAFEPGAAISLPQISECQQIAFDPHGIFHRYNADGVCCWSDFPEPGNFKDGYQLFRNGIFEAIDGNGIHRGDISLQHFDILAVCRLKNTIEQLRKRGAEPPYHVLISGFGLNGLRVVTGGHMWPSERSHIDRDVVQLPDVLIRSLDDDIPSVMRPVLDAFWQAGGFPGSRSYNESGEWAGKPLE